ncbi:MAG: hypothetical protein PGN13_08720 [Patulibacter minatonensis]
MKVIAPLSVLTAPPSLLTCDVYGVGPQAVGLTTRFARSRSTSTRRSCSATPRKRTGMSESKVRAGIGRPEPDAARHDDVAEVEVADGRAHHDHDAGDVALLAGGEVHRTGEGPRAVTRRRRAR